MDHLQDSSRTRIIPPSDRVWVGVPAHTYAHTVTVVTCRYRRVREGKEERRFHARLPLHVTSRLAPSNRRDPRQADLGKQVGSTPVRTEGDKRGEGKEIASSSPPFTVSK